MKNLPKWFGEWELVTDTNPKLSGATTVSALTEEDARRAVKNAASRELSGMTTEVRKHITVLYICGVRSL